jgi:hypothetical protein
MHVCNYLLPFVAILCYFLLLVTSCCYSRSLFVTIVIYVAICCYFELNLAPIDGNLLSPIGGLCGNHSMSRTEVTEHLPCEAAAPIGTPGPGWTPSSRDLSWLTPHGATDVRIA